MLRAGKGKKGGKYAWKEEVPLFPSLEEEKQPCGENGGGDSTKNSPDPGVTHPCAAGSWWPQEGECPTAPSPARGEISKAQVWGRNCFPRHTGRLLLDLSLCSHS